MQNLIAIIVKRFERSGLRRQIDAVAFRLNQSLKVSESDTNRSTTVTSFRCSIVTVMGLPRTVSEIMGNIVEKNASFPAR